MRDELNTEDMLTVLGETHMLNPRRVVFTGGEPLLRKDMSKLGQEFKTMNSEARMCLTTNGTLISEENAEGLVKNFDEIRISIDGFEEINDAIRGKGTFQETMKAFKYTIEAGGEPTAFITVTSINLPFLKDFMKFLLRNEITNIHLSPLRLAGRAKDDKMLCDLEETKRVANEFLHETFGLQLRNERKELFNCGVGNFLTVYPDGSVYPCHLLAFPEFCIGNVRKQGLYSIYYQSRLMNKLRNLDFREINPCIKCFKEFSREATCLGTSAQQKNSRENLLNLLS